MTIFQYSDYKSFVKEYVEQMPKRGRGEYQNLAKVLQMHTTTISHVFKGDKDLTLEQAAKLCMHWGLNDLESNYLVSLVELARAGSNDLKKILKNRIEDLRQSSQVLKNRIPKDHVLGDAERARFYSEWYFSAIRLKCDLPGVNSVDRISRELDLPAAVVNKVMQFLLETGLVVQEKNHLKLGPGRTYVEAASPLVKRHHANWRLKAIQSYPRMNDEVEFALTSPMTISSEDAVAVREVLMKTTEKILAINKQSASEELRVLNIDWLKV